MVIVASDGNISAVYHDILLSHILTRLDGPTLASVSCASSELHTLSTDDHLWQNICSSTWPSVQDPLVSSVISTFPSAHRSFYSDSYPLLHHDTHSFSNLQASIPTTTQLISAVDIYYQNVPIFSKVEKSDTVSGWFLCSPFKVQLLEPKEFVPTWIPQAGAKDCWLIELQDNLTLSWNLIDPELKRAVNLSSKKPVSVQRHWLTGEVQVKFAIVIAGERKGSEKEYVECEVMVTCGGKEGGEVEVRDVSMGMTDMEGKALTGKDSLVILKEGMENGERKKVVKEEVKERHEQFLKKKKERKQSKQMKESIVDWMCIAAGVTSFMTFWSYVLFR